MPGQAAIVDQCGSALCGCCALAVAPMDRAVQC